jgi:hypothetical protein
MFVNVARFGSNIIATAGAHAMRSRSRSIAQSYTPVMHCSRSLRRWQVALLVVIALCVLLVACSTFSSAHQVHWLFLGLFFAPIVLLGLVDTLGKSIHLPPVAILLRSCPTCRLFFQLPHLQWPSSASSTLTNALLARVSVRRCQAL